MNDLGTPPISGYAFDLYGTLVDFRSLKDRFPGAHPSPDAFVTAWRAKQLALTWQATLMNRYTDFDTLTAAAYAWVAPQFALDANAAAQAEAVSAARALPAFPDAPAALASLRARGARTAVLSNGTPSSLAAILEHCGLAGAFDLVISVEEVRAYKPHPSVYALACERLALPPNRLGFVSSNGWDAAGAAEFGLRVVWCNRYGLPRETFGKPPEREIATLGEI